MALFAIASLLFGAGAAKQIISKFLNFVLYKAGAVAAQFFLLGDGTAEVEVV
jgi:hypothetical protein